ncbi:MAG TPA: hypothetical protein VF391_09580 [Dermatophilaceae bacterium]
MSILREGRRTQKRSLTRYLPAHSDNIGLFGTITVDVDHELANSGPPATGPCASRPQRPTAEGWASGRRRRRAHDGGKPVAATGQ